LPYDLLVRLHATDSSGLRLSFGVHSSELHGVAAPLGLEAVMNDLRETECAKCGSGTRSEEWNAQPDGEQLVAAWCDNPYCEDYRAAPAGA
jgi:hypothetical protein